MCQLQFPKDNLQAEVLVLALRVLLVIRLQLMTHAKREIFHALFVCLVVPPRRRFPAVADPWIEPDVMALWRRLCGGSIGPRPSFRTTHHPDWYAAGSPAGLYKAVTELA
jgi:hypothetical protein